MISGAFNITCAETVQGNLIIMVAKSNLHQDKINAVN